MTLRRRSVRTDRPFRQWLAAVALAAAMTWPAPAPAQVAYAVYDLGVPAGPYDRTFARSVNDLGQVAGYSDLSTGAENFGFRHTPSVGFEPLGLPPGAIGGFSNPYGINAGGQVAGDVVIAGVGGRAFRWTAGVGMVALPILPGSTTAHGYAINALGQVAGSSGTSAQSVARWSSAGTVESLGLPAGRISGAGYAINGPGQVVVTAVDSFGEARGYLYTDGAGYRDLGSLGGPRVEAWGINDAGQVVGSARLPGGPPNVTHAFVWSAASGMTDLGALPGGSFAQAYAINALGVLVGESETASAPRHAFVYRDGAMRDLNDLIVPATGWTLEIAWDVSDSGLIVGTGRLNGLERSFLLTPVPEPSSLALAGGTLAAVCVTRRMVRQTRADRKRAIADSQLGTAWRVDGLQTKYVLPNSAQRSFATVVDLVVRVEP